MTLRKWLTVIGAVFLIVGLLSAFLSSHYAAELRGERRGGILVAPAEGTSAWKKNEILLKQSDGYFYAGLFLTALGVVLQTVAAILPLRSKSPQNH